MERWVGAEEYKSTVFADPLPPHALAIVRAFAFQRLSPSHLPPSRSILNAFYLFLPYLLQPVAKRPAWGEQQIAATLLLAGFCFLSDVPPDSDVASSVSAPAENVGPASGKRLTFFTRSDENLDVRAEVDSAEAVAARLLFVRAGEGGAFRLLSLSFSDAEEVR